MRLRYKPKNRLQTRASQNNYIKYLESFPIDHAFDLQFFEWHPPIIDEDNFSIQINDNQNNDQLIIDNADYIKYTLEDMADFGFAEDYEEYYKEAA